ncbi:MAG: CD225/dispanin family protein [Planctomycetes bacterium]|nr:CD225/dispanin family protein [Planctomycetota bacterium]
MSQLPPDNPFADFPEQNPYASPTRPPVIYPHKPYPPGVVKNYLVEAILCLVCCGGVFAIPAIVYAAQVNPKLQSGDYDGALRASASARMWCIIAVCIGVTCTGISILFQIAVLSSQGGF